MFQIFISPGLELTGYFDFYPAQRIQFVMEELKFRMQLDLIMRLELVCLLGWLLKLPHVFLIFTFATSQPVRIIRSSRKSKYSYSTY